MQPYWFLIEYFASNHIDFMSEFLKQPNLHRCCYCCDTEVLVWRWGLCILQRPNFVLTCQQHNNGFARYVFIWQVLRCCRKFSPVGATWSWSRWCSRRTSPPPPARPPYYIYYDQESGILQSTCSTILCCFLLKDHQFDLRFSTVWCYGKYLLNLQPPTTLHWVKDYLNENFLFQMIHKVIEKIWSWSRKCWANI